MNKENPLKASGTSESKDKLGLTDVGETTEVLSKDSGSLDSSSNENNADESEKKANPTKVNDTSESKDKMSLTDVGEKTEVLSKDRGSLDSTSNENNADESENKENRLKAGGTSESRDKLSLTDVGEKTEVLSKDRGSLDSTANDIVRSRFAGKKNYSDEERDTENSFNYSCLRNTATKEYPENERGMENRDGETISEPLLALCMNYSCIGTDIQYVLSTLGDHDRKSIAVLVVHATEPHALPLTMPTENHICAEFDGFGALVDFAFTSERGWYDCQMNTAVKKKLSDFLHKFGFRERPVRNSWISGIVSFFTLSDRVVSLERENEELSRKVEMLTKEAAEKVKEIGRLNALLHRLTVALPERR